MRAVNLVYDCCGALSSVLVMRRDGLDGFEGGLPPTGFEVVDGVRAQTLEAGDLYLGVVSRHVTPLENHWSS